MTAFPYQVMPPLSADEYAALKADIGARGVQVPVEYDEAGAILDGHHRVQICGELEISQWPRLIRYGLSEEEKRQHARRLNLDRRHLDHEQKRALIASELRETPESSDRAIASGLGVDHKTVGSVRDDMESTGEIPQLEAREGRDKKIRRITQFVPSNKAEETGVKLAAKALSSEKQETQRANRRDLAQALADTSDQLLTGRKVPCVYIDPAFARKGGIGDRAYENHYPTEKWEAIIDIMKKAASRLQNNAWAFIWIPRAHMLALHPVPYTIQTEDGATHTIDIRTPLIWAIARALGMTDYSTCFVWTKTDEEHPDEHGMFLIARDQDEILCLYKKGDGLPKPATQHIYGSNHRERSRPLGHSVKPPFYRKMIADMVGTDRDGRPLPVLEMFSRFDADNPLPENWEAWGNESQETLTSEENTNARGANDKEDQARNDDSVRRDAGPPIQGPGTAESFAEMATGKDLSGSAGHEPVASPSDVAASEIPQEASGTAREAPSTGSGSSFDEGTQSAPPPLSDDEHRWETEGGSTFRSDDLIMKPLRSSRARAR